jgi:hypothetical protein
MTSYIIELTAEEKVTFVESLALLINDANAQSSSDGRVCLRLLARLDSALRKG